MSKIIKRLLTVGIALCLSVSFAVLSFAGEWKRDAEIDTWWWYQREDGTYPADCWEQIDGTYYHFDWGGYLETDTITYDGYHVDENGAWIESIPQMSQAEMDQYYFDFYYETLVSCYVGEIFETEEEFEDNAFLFFDDPVQAEQVINDIRSEYTFVPYEN